MPVKRRLIKGRVHRITPEAIEAFAAGDFLALHQALGLKPWEVSPLPLEIELLGVDQGPPPADSSWAWRQSWPKAQELQRLLLQDVPNPSRA